MTQEELEKMHAIQREFLHDAATSLEIDPEDEIVHKGDYCLVFDSYRRALAVARLAAKNYRDEYDDDFLNSRTKPPRPCDPAVMLFAGMGRSGGYLATLDFIKD